MGWLTFVLLGIAFYMLMSRGHGGMGCCGGGHGDHHSGHSENKGPHNHSPVEKEGNVIDLREKEYKVITSGKDRLSHS